MTDRQSDVVDKWSEALDKLDIVAPEGRRSDRWKPVVQTFGQRGFVRLTRDESGEQLQIQLAVPGRSVEATRQALRELLEERGFKAADADNADAAEDDDAAAVEARVPTGDGTDAELVEQLTDIIEQVQLVGDAIEDDEFEDLPAWLHTSASATDNHDRSEDSEHRSGPEDAGDVFEPIGEGSSSSDDADGPDPDVEFEIEHYEIGETQGRQVRLRIHFTSPIPSTDISYFAEGLAHALRARFDVNAMLKNDDLGPGAKESIELIVEPTNTAPDELDAGKETDQYLERLVRFQELGVPTAETLGLRASDERTAPGRRTTSDEEESSTGGDLESSSREDRRDNAPQDEYTEGDSQPDRQTSQSDSEDSPDAVTLSGSEESETLGDDPSNEHTLGGESTEPTGPLEAGYFTDPRLMREDATTSLVDVILRHPGYRDERMAQVLSILLSLDYPDAKTLVADAPTHLAWGVGRERANRMKRVIEDSGGKVVFVEPDSIPG